MIRVIGMSVTISLVSIGPIPADLLPWLADRLGEVFSRRVVVGEVIPLPITGHNAGRRQYRGDTLKGQPMSARCHIGASGWIYAHWRGTF